MSVAHNVSIDVSDHKLAQNLSFGLARQEVSALLLARNLSLVLLSQEVSACPLCWLMIRLKLLKLKISRLEPNYSLSAKISFTIHTPRIS